MEDFSSIVDGYIKRYGSDNVDFIYVNDNKLYVCLQLRIIPGVPANRTWFIARYVTVYNNTHEHIQTTGQITFDAALLANSRIIKLPNCYMNANMILRLLDTSRCLI